LEVLRLKRLSKEFGGVHAVDDVSFSVEAGERLAIIGPNGAGKTTLFNLINGQLSVTRGKIDFCGKDITNLPTHKRVHLGQARAFQIISLWQKLTVVDNAMLTLHGLRPHRYTMFRPSKDFREVFDQAGNVLATLGLWEKKDEPVSSLAYGEKRRLEIGLALAMRPKLLLLDEPSAGLSREEASEVISFMRGLESRITLLMVDHDMDMVFEVAERIIVLHYGKVISDGIPEVIQGDRRVREIYIGIEK
jgi:branched-chain amino acid transport system ATP-binding protein